MLILVKINRVKEKKQVIILLNFSGFLASLSDPHGQGNFGPFQICYDYGISVCGGYPGGFQTRGKTKTPYENDMTAFMSDTYNQR